MNIDKSLLNKKFDLKELTVKDKQVQIYDNCFADGGTLRRVDIYILVLSSKINSNIF